uniref:non-specific serine/threonine protein kinase n=1 Tax=Chenopodium quinoa TaxID=63459 RepID=A0A803LX33_CHEQI
MMSMIILVLISLLALHASAQNETQFIFNGFKGSINKVHVDGLATILPNGLLQMTNYTAHNLSHAFYPHPVIFKPNHTSFSTTFVFAMYPRVVNHSGHGIAFVISPTTDFRHAQPATYLGIFNASTSSLSSKDNTNQSLNHIFAVELDTGKNVEVNDIDANHVGIDINSLKSKDAAPASYYSDKEGVNKTLRLTSEKPMTIWIDYDEVDMIVNVTLAPLGHPKPSKHLLSKYFNLSTVLLESMYVGFSSSTGVVANSHYILGWSWNQSGKAQDLDPSKLPSLPRTKHRKLSLSHLIFVVLLSVVLLLLLLIYGAVFFVWRKKYEELLEPWEKEYVPHRFSYKDLYVATRGFRNSELLGVGGFGKVYKGVLSSTGDQVAVKRVSHDSKQGMKEFVAEISSMRIEKVEGSSLCWSSRFNIIKEVASSLLYLHEEWEQVVLHRDVKASNVLLDADMNARLGDFGLARLYDHNIDPRTTHVVGTIGYIAPEVSRTQKPTTKSDVFAYGMFLLEVCCGRRPSGKQSDNEVEEFLSDWVYDFWKKGEILKTSDPKMEGDYQEEEIELVVKFLNGSAALPDIPSEYDIESHSFIGEGWVASGSLASSLPSSSGNISVGVMSSTNSVLQYGR